MKKSIFILFVITLTLAACQSASQTSEVSPTDTPQPTAVVATETPQPQISPEVQAKFDQAGVDLGEMENATTDEDGLHITIDGKAIDINTETLKAYTFNSIRDNSIRIIDTANKDGVFVMAQTTEGKWVFEKQVFCSDPLKLDSRYKLPDSRKRSTKWQEPEGYSARTTKRRWSWN